MADKLVAGSTGAEQGCSLINTHNHGDGGVGSQIPTAGIVDSAVTTAKLADGAVTAAKITNETIDETKLTAELSKKITSGGAAGANAPGCYIVDEHFHTTDKTVITSPASAWINVGGNGLVISSAVTLDISLDATWDTKASAWEASHAYAVDDVVYPATKAGYLYRCTTAGTSSALSPSFPTTIGTTYNDGNVVWICQWDYTKAGNRLGKDFYIYACVPLSGSTPSLVISENSTAPVRYTATNSRKVGGFHCLCANVGTISGHTLSGYVIGDVLPQSVWDLSHRPKCDPEGMAYNAGTDMWNMIYLASWTGTTAANTLKLVSKYGAVTADGSSTEKFHWYKFADTMSQQNMRHPWHREFMAYARGSNQGTAINGAADANTTGGHVDTAGRRMISNDGLEDCCGFLWQWIEDTGSASSGSWTGAYDANDFSDIKGSSYTTPYKGLAGGRWDSSGYCGSRCSAWSYGALALDGAVGARGTSEPRKNVI